jgi:hypothetical protein
VQDNKEDDSDKENEKKQQQNQQQSQQNQQREFQWARCDPISVKSDTQLPSHRLRVART